MRTSLSLIAFGFVVARFALFSREVATLLHVPVKTQHTATGSGTGIALFGALVAAFGAYRYLATNHAVARNRPVSATPIAATISAAILVITGIAVGIGLIAFQ